MFLGTFIYCLKVCWALAIDNEIRIPWNNNIKYERTFINILIVPRNIHIIKNLNIYH